MTGSFDFFSMKLISHASKATKRSLLQRGCNGIFWHCIILVWTLENSSLVSHLLDGSLHNFHSNSRFLNDSVWLSTFFFPERKFKYLCTQDYWNVSNIDETLSSALWFFQHLFIFWCHFSSHLLFIHVLVSHLPEVLFVTEVLGTDNCIYHNHKSDMLQ